MLLLTAAYSMCPLVQFVQILHQFFDCYLYSTKPLVNNHMSYVSAGLPATLSQELETTHQHCPEAQQDSLAGWQEAQPECLASQQKAHQHLSGVPNSKQCCKVEQGHMFIALSVG